MLVLKIALNYLLAEKKKTLITFLIVSFGISMLVFLAGFLCGTGKFSYENISGLRAYGYAVIVLAIVDSLIISGLAVYNNLTSTINKKLKEITILKITGFTAKDIHNIFLSQSLFIGAAGTVAGLFFGYILLFILSKFSFTETGLFENYFSVHFSMLAYAVTFTTGIAITMIAAFQPLKKASDLNPIKILNS
jgi:ABC-type lipoprotein release transport system permease subunit